MITEAQLDNRKVLDNSVCRRVYDIAQWFNSAKANTAATYY